MTNDELKRWVLSWDEEDGWHVFGDSMPNGSTVVLASDFDQTIRERDARIEKLVEALKYYADPMNYSIDYDTSEMGFSRRCILYGDIEQRNEASGLAGERARKALEGEQEKK